MKKKNFHFTLKHIILITSILILIKISISIYYTYSFIEDVVVGRGQLLVNALLQTRNDFLSTDRMSTIQFTHNTALVEYTSRHGKDSPPVKISKSVRKPSKHI
mgnify:CR=1 FL=1